MKVAVVLPARNAASLLRECLASVSRQTRPPDEIWVVVAPSSDHTDEVARGLPVSPLRLLDNPAGDRGSGINRALDETDADVIAMVDAQARLAPDYLERALARLERSGASVVGGPIRPRGVTAVGRAMAAALVSPFGVGDSQFHFAVQAGAVDSVYLGVYRSAAFATVGHYNSALLRAEDDDMNARIREAGLRIWLDPAIRSTYLCRNRLGEIWSQYEGYGYWKVALATIRPGSIRARHVVPAAFVLALVPSAAVSLIAWWPAFPLLLSAHLLAGLVTGAVVPVEGLSARLLVPVVILTMHLAYGIGTLRGLLSWRRLRARVGARAGQ